MGFEVKEVDEVIARKAETRKNGYKLKTSWHLDLEYYLHEFFHLSSVLWWVFKFSVKFYNLLFLSSLGKLQGLMILDYHSLWATTATGWCWVAPPADGHVLCRWAPPIPPGWARSSELVLHLQVVESSALREKDTDSRAPGPWHLLWSKSSKWVCWCLD